MYAFDRDISIASSVVTAESGKKRIIAENEQITHIELIEPQGNTN